ncbi:transcriptional regulator, SarA/Rot family [Companilactobacillus sp. DQM5]|uniref:transcriptional regulator, SarA/Rot family n=1 Tax=Companilactobacillus sp. DQM5 TaxID=3463359 RepID=UPI004058C12E
MVNVMTENMTLDSWYIQQSQLMNKLDRIASKYGLSFLQYKILLQIECYKSSSPTDIAKGLKLSRTSVSRSLKGLQKKEMIGRIYGNSDDQRKVEIRVTPSAKKIIEKLSNDLLEVKI